MLRSFIIVCFALLVGCTSTPPPAEAPPDPVVLISEAVEGIRAAKTFRISVSESGPDYLVFTEFATVYFRRAVAQYVAPGLMQASIRVLAAGIPIQVDVFSHGADQWFRAIWTGNRWLNQPFAPNFNPTTLIAENTGFQAAMRALIDLSYVGEEQLENGAQVYHLAATANGPDVSALLGNLIEPEGAVEVEVYIDTSTRYPARFVITEHNSPYVVTPEPGQQAEPVIWTIDLYDIGAAPDLSTPEALVVTEEAGTPEASGTAELLVPLDGAATPEATDAAS